MYLRVFPIAASWAMAALFSLLVILVLYAWSERLPNFIDDTDMVSPVYEMDDSKDKAAYFVKGDGSDNAQLPLAREVESTDRGNGAITEVDMTDDTNASESTSDESSRETLRSWNAVVVVPAANVREIPGVETKIVIQLKKGDRLFVTENKDDWSKISGVDGYPDIEDVWIYSPLISKDMH
jgi:hypothetical protein